ncbi:hypothetical protein BFF78_29440 [Streptomyces fodineus]|uniref:Uncharacterized protein n=1 Tax=Streptomyces fodineus TaxID=1904616 RepID=A0A1D7YGI9_9ACTN|nr:hypothetical protein [Streptomyces fodineus]AOR34624.1 hypothetical protein BFF78_29440 [Streptomyces fodineus]
MPIDLRLSLRRHYMTFLAVLVTGIVLIMAVNGTAQSTELYLHCFLGVGGLIAGYALAPPEPSRPGDPDQRPGVTESEA